MIAAAFSAHIKAGWNNHGLRRVEHTTADRREHVPEAQGFVSRPRDDILAAWAN